MQPLVEALVERGARVHLLLDRVDSRQGLPEELLAACATVHRLASLDSLEELAGVAVQLRELGVTAVVGHSEVSQFGAGYLALLLGLHDDALTHVRHRDKRLMKQAAHTAGVTTARIATVAGPTPEAVGGAVGAAGLTWPVVLKPAAGFGGMSTLRLDSSSELAGRLAPFRLDPLIRSRALVVEEFVDGSEIAVDSLWIDGEVQYSVVHRYHQPRLTHATPDETTMDGSRVLAAADHPELVARLRDLHERLAGPLELRTCATHLEAFWQPDGTLVFSEIATRQGGAWIPGLLAAHFGRPVWELYAEGVTRGAVRPDVLRPHVGSVSVHPTSPGTVTAMPTEDDLRGLPGVVGWEFVRTPGDRARLAHPSEYYLHVYVEGASEDEVVARCRHVVRTARVRTAA